ncbi:Spo0E like sporulation regulatory protein [Bacillus sp. OV194]|uniref:aspartyl-phosphate phosphatase Spo0E family protein n=1 Tax=Fictibacillus sp. B-59209 TaxID=3024873 RepID=UPI0006A7CDD5|nr:aspartyl-phosphate phosphatase Spo0E family protein [Fictibacillus sp. B-59209]MED2971721.1 aspartyl-phosphate phosphatase Spo0E family protein [Fictibacillus sp. B-59209]SFE75636.1 Spo0E like sporulation regulatory protein [Bacillus sp. OV194]
MSPALNRELLELIENKRTEMVLSAMEKGFHSEETISRGNELNELLNCYHKLLSIHSTDRI